MAADSTGITYAQPSPLVNDSAARAMEFNGSTGKIDIPYSSALNSATFTIESWFFKVSTPPANDPLWDCRPASSGANAAGFDLFFNVGSGIGIAICKANQSQVLLTTTAIPNQEWHYAASTYDGANVRIYIDGALRAGPTAAPFTQNPTAASAIAHLTNNGSNFSPARLAEMAFYSSPIDSRIRAHYQAGILFFNNRLGARDGKATATSRQPVARIAVRS